ncbi:hypothetical protein Cst_c07470 [Thermoclostridium stercorarium subsp. stercorarium DSM 8532]|uniref:Transposase n=1 Tax=Thermoclostridium stercorarium (strain ATCC 35414 / DSM 8532 / NCIMB 11754) TaxID=1121335 RepID=L7VMR1_THES1|nr:hypothetical protein Cst_c07470 [Thermoclostridium stercorarium subsp. stercorarium DSM 8532]
MAENHRAYGNGCMQTVYLIFNFKRRDLCDMKTFYSMSLETSEK